MGREENFLKINKWVYPSIWDLRVVAPSMRNYKSKDMLLLLLWKEGSLELPWEEVKRTNIYSFLCITKESRYVEGFFWHICLCFDNREDCYSHRHSTNSALFFSQLLAHCFNVDFSLHPKIIDKLRTIQVILESVSDNSVNVTHFCPLTGT